jgi:hypothetical protein
MNRTAMQIKSPSDQGAILEVFSPFNNGMNCTLCQELTNRLRNPEHAGKTFEASDIMPMLFRAFRGATNSDRCVRASKVALRVHMVDASGSLAERACIARQQSAIDSVCTFHQLCQPWQL